MELNEITDTQVLLSCTLQTPWKCEDCGVGTMSYFEKRGDFLEHFCLICHVHGNKHPSGRKLHVKKDAEVIHVIADFHRSTVAFDTYKRQLGSWWENAINNGWAGHA